MEASISSIEGSRCTLLAVAIVTSAAFVTNPRLFKETGFESVQQSVTDAQPSENPQYRPGLDFNRLGYVDAQRPSCMTTPCKRLICRKKSKVPGHQDSSSQQADPVGAIRAFPAKV
jgi:hypothetical protein